MESSASLRTRPAQAALGRTPHSRRAVRDHAARSAMSHRLELLLAGSALVVVILSGARAAVFWPTAAYLNTTAGAAGGSSVRVECRTAMSIRSRRLIRTPGAFPPSKTSLVPRPSPLASTRADGDASNDRRNISVQSAHMFDNVRRIFGQLFVYGSADVAILAEHNVL